MTTINLAEYQDKPFSQLQSVLLRCGFHITSRVKDREHDLTGVTFVRSKGGHDKVKVWHGWCTPDSTGICQAGLVTDIEYRDLEVREELVIRNNGNAPQEAQGSDTCNSGEDVS